MFAAIHLMQRVVGKELLQLHVVIDDVLAHEEGAACRAQHPRNLREPCIKVDEVMQDLPPEDEVRRSAGEGQVLAIGTYGSECATRHVDQLSYRAHPDVSTRVGIDGRHVPAATGECVGRDCATCTNIERPAGTAAEDARDRAILATFRVPCRRLRNANVEIVLFH